MKNLLSVLIVCVFVLSLGVAGCAKQAATSQEAIQQSKTMKTVDEQAQFLVSQANAFVSSKKFDQAAETAKYVLANLDANSQEAKAVLQKAAEEMKKSAQTAVDDIKNKIGTLGK